MPIRNSCGAPLSGSCTVMSSQPSTHSGSSYCEIWKFLGMSG